MPVTGWWHDSGHWIRHYGPAMAQISKVGPGYYLARVTTPEKGTVYERPHGRLQTAKSVTDSWLIDHIETPKKSPKKEH